MADREEVIRGLECCASDDDGYCERRECPYADERACVDTLMRDALALLKAQEPRVMTLEEAKAAYVVEYRSGRMNEIGAAINTLDVDPNNVYYGDIYRVWTSRPTEEQRKAVRWE